MEEGREVERRLEVVMDEVEERKKKKRVGKGKREFSKETFKKEGGEWATCLKCDYVRSWHRGNVVKIGKKGAFCHM